MNIKNKIITGICAIIICGLSSLTSCQDMLDIDSSNYIDAEDKYFDSANDTLYSVAGILKQLQQLGERYVVLGELRGELMDVTENANMDLQEIANFAATVDNPYVSTREYYAVINNCNYFLQRVDTTIVSGGKKVMKGEYAVVKAIRAWTYMQLALNYGKAVYFTEPILSTDDMNRDHPELSAEQLITELLSDIGDALDETIYPTYGGDFPSNAFISGPMVAADLCLWMGAFTGNNVYYETAASIYYALINYHGYRGAWNYMNRYTGRTFEELSFATAWSPSIFQESQERITTISYSLDADETKVLPALIRLTFPNVPGSNIQLDYAVKPAQAAMDLWNNETYIHYVEASKEFYYTKGDLRGIASQDGYEPNGSYYYHDQDKTIPCIAKFGHFIITDSYYSTNFRPRVALYRAGTLYLRYAEALNALGKPSLAFAVLKHGLKNEVLSDPKIINPEEIMPLPEYCDFTNSRYSQTGMQWQRGMHDRGCGYSSPDTVYYAFTQETLQENLQYYGFPEDLTNKQDSILFVDAMICKELGLETAFEGNRFQDLMRFSIRRNDDNFLAKWVGRRNPALTATLANRDNWFLPVPK